MDLPMNLIYDLVLGLLLLSILYRSWRQGFIASFIRLAGTAAGFLVASFLSRPMAEKLYDGLLAKKVEAYVADTLLAPDSPLSSALAGLDQAGSAALHLVTQFLSERGLDFYTAGDAGEMGEKILSGILNGTDPAATVAQVVIKPMALTILQTVIFFVILTLAGMVVRAITRVGLGVNHIPLVGGLNRLAGLACGAVYALLLGYVIASALLLLAGLGQNQWDWLNSGILRDTVLIRGLLSLRTWLP
ncbi:MAG: hypothetical protein HFF10_09755 [Angelakisella sp.]|nr:hypothetical protein [Angelakisella sp.]